MLAWLSGLLGWAIGGTDDLWKKVVSVFQTVVSYIDSSVSQLIGDVNSVWQWLNTFVGQVDKLVDSVYTSIYNWSVRSFANITSWVNNIYGTLRGAISDTVAWTTAWIDRIYKDVTGWIGDLETWVLRDIWDPLYKSLAGAVQWIGTYGSWTVYLLSHPEQLALILGRYILGSWLNLGHKYAKPVARWMLHSMMSAAGDVAGLLEDFIAGIL